MLCAASRNIMQNAQLLRLILHFSMTIVEEDVLKFTRRQQHISPATPRRRPASDTLNGIRQASYGEADALRFHVRSCARRGVRTTMDLFGWKVTSPCRQCRTRVERHDGLTRGRAVAEICEPEIPAEKACPQMNSAFSHRNLLFIPFWMKLEY